MRTVISTSLAHNENHLKISLISAECFDYK